LKEEISGMAGEVIYLVSSSKELKEG